jgi:hypothetical protein
MSTVFDEFEEQPKRRTTFITVLCILTFVGSGFSLLTNIYGYFTAKQSAEQMQLVQKMAQNDSAFAPQKGKSSTQDSLKEKQSKEFTKKIFSSISTSFTEDNLKKNALGAILAAILCIGGAILMFQINKKGYLLYVAGTLVGIAIPLMLYGSNFMGILGSVVSGFFGLVFCILYGVNLKDMK